MISQRSFEWLSPQEKYEQLMIICPQLVKDFVVLSQRYSWDVTFVGGTARDLLKFGQSQDWDLELSTSTTQSIQDYELFLEACKELGKIERTQHLVVKIKKEQEECEFAPPRREIYAANPPYAHDDFKSQIDFSLSFEQSVQRRDFTFNAIGLKISQNTLVLLDPTEGLKDFNQGCCRIVNSQTFVKDPVRLLRAHRFKLKYGLSWDSQLSEFSEEFDLHFLSFHYLKTESLKSLSPFVFWNELQKYQTLPPTFQGGLLQAQQMDQKWKNYHHRLSEKAQWLMPIFVFNEGWHILTALHITGHQEAESWRWRRQLLDDLKFLGPEIVLGDAELLRKTTQILKIPLDWMRKEWVLQFLEAYHLSWLISFFDFRVDLSSYLPEERKQQKVKLWLETLTSK